MFLVVGMRLRVGKLSRNRREKENPRYRDDR